MEIATARLVLREFRAGDFKALHEFESMPVVHQYERGLPAEEDIRAYLQRAANWAAESPRTHVRLAICVPPSDCVRGRIALTLNFAETREWEVGWAVHPAWWGRGIATEAAAKMLEYAFCAREAHRVVAFCNTANLASRRVMEKLGMQCEGRLREERRWNDGWGDTFVYAILEREWQPQPAS